MWGRLVRHSPIVHLTALLTVAACYRPPMRAALASVTPSPAVATQRAVDDVTQRSAPLTTLTITTESGTATVDVLDDSATTKAIRSLISGRVPELKVEPSNGINMIRIGSTSPIAVDGPVWSARRKWARAHLDVALPLTVRR